MYVCCEEEDTENIALFTNVFSMCCEHMKHSFFKVYKGIEDLLENFIVQDDRVFFICYFYIRVFRMRPSNAFLQYIVIVWITE